MKKGYGNYEVQTKERFIEERGYHPRQFADVKGLTGDTSDHYPGVKGIRPKTAEKLILQFQTVDNILASLDELKPGQRKKIEADRELLILSRKLAEIKLHVPLSFNLDDAKIRFFHDNLHDSLNIINIKGMTRILDMIKEWDNDSISHELA